MERTNNEKCHAALHILFQDHLFLPLISYIGGSGQVTDTAKTFSFALWQWSVGRSA